MNRSELVQLVAKEAQVEDEIVEDVLDWTTEIIALTLTMGEEVVWRRFGKFRPLRRSAASLRNPKTGEPIDVGPRLTAGFAPSTALKRRLNGDPIPFPLASRQRLGRRQRLPVDHVHRYLWTLVDDKHWVVTTVTDVASHFKVERGMMQRTFASMCKAGRIRRLGCERGKKAVWQVANPNSFYRDREERDTLPDSRKPVWG